MTDRRIPTHHFAYLSAVPLYVHNRQNESMNFATRISRQKMTTNSSQNFESMQWVSRKYLIFEFFLTCGFSERFEKNHVLFGLGVFRSQCSSRECTSKIFVADVLENCCLTVSTYFVLGLLLLPSNLDI